MDYWKNVPGIDDHVNLDEADADSKTFNEIVSLLEQAQKKTNDFKDAKVKKNVLKMISGLISDLSFNKLK
jgi:hypothetical protein